MKIKPRQKRKTELSEAEAEDLKDALSELDDIESYELSEADVACDNLASELLATFLSHRKASFTGRTPSLYEVIEKMLKDYGSDDEHGRLDDAANAADELKTRLEDSYREDREDDISEEVGEWATELAAAFRSFLEEKSWIK